MFAIPKPEARDPREKGDRCPGAPPALRVPAVTAGLVKAAARRSCPSWMSCLLFDILNAMALTMVQGISGRLQCMKHCIQLNENHSHWATGPANTGVTPENLDYTWTSRSE